MDMPGTSSIGTSPSRCAADIRSGRSLVYCSASMSRLSALVERVAPRDVTVLITGESGTGKERIADALVDYPRAPIDFLRFNCAALTAELAERSCSDIRRASPTVGARRGLFREADGGPSCSTNWDSASCRPSSCAFSKRESARSGKARSRSTSASSRRRTGTFGKWRSKAVFANLFTDQRETCRPCARRPEHSATRPSLSSASARRSVSARSC